MAENHGVLKRFVTTIIAVAINITTQENSYVALVISFYQRNPGTLVVDPESTMSTQNCAVDSPQRKRLVLKMPAAEHFRTIAADTPVVVELLLLELLVISIWAIAVGMYSNNKPFFFFLTEIVFLVAFIWNVTQRSLSVRPKERLLITPESSWSDGSDPRPPLTTILIIIIIIDIIIIINHILCLTAREVTTLTLMSVVMEKLA